MSEFFAQNPMALLLLGIIIGAFVGGWWAHTRTMNAFMERLDQSIRTGEIEVK